MFFEGARSGSNYFLREVVLTNGAFHANSDFAIGRDGLETYHLNPNSVTHTFDQSDSATPKHALLASSKVYFSLVSEILNMGLPSGIDPRGISWVDNDFTGLRYDNGLRVRGRLEVSNGYPCVLSIYSEQETRPYLAFRYMYPDPPSRLSGFPEKTTLSRITGGVLKPWMEVTLVDVRLAGDNETTKLFAKEQFISERIQHTHFYSNGILFTVSPEGKVYKSPKQPVVRLLGESTPDDKRRRSLLVILLLVIAGPPVVYLLFRSVKNNKSG